MGLPVIRLGEVSRKGGRLWLWVGGLFFLGGFGGLLLGQENSIFYFCLGAVLGGYGFLLSQHKRGQTETLK